MSVTTSEFIFFKIKPSVRPEELGNKEGEELQQVFDDTKHQSGHESSAWGRSAEDENMITWVLEWTDARSSANTDHLKRYLDLDAQPPMAVYSTLCPPLASSNTLTSNPVTEICVLSFASSLSGRETKQLHNDLINFRTSLLELSEAARPKSWSMGQVDRPSTVEHAKSPSGKAVLHILTVGWESVEAHKKSRETDEFVSAIAPIREKSLGALPGLDMKHVSFRKL
ncbi:hypothetical protein N7478_003075 [Penicillium angulare]|uniref:uncharacterized protein n=1 Tax=Penicillium angulare TaxID=116970 RepID=UPI002541B99B|nr:uncharacterized protein N7478_003075 [Penicillium angulare]KAJ5287389.1 hypothetical protein N7478_003075 [Penicillium angulare]